MTDIISKNDIEKLVNTFYKKAMQDEKIGHIFQNHMSGTLENHLPIIYHFWESVLLERGTYKGNPIKKHIELGQKTPLGNFHFKQWLRLWEETTDSLFKGQIADQAKAKARMMKDLMVIKIKQSNNPNFIQ